MSRWASKFSRPRRPHLSFSDRARFTSFRAGPSCAAGQAYLPAHWRTFTASPRREHVISCCALHGALLAPAGIAPSRRPYASSVSCQAMFCAGASLFGGTPPRLLQEHQQQIASCCDASVSPCVEEAHYRFSVRAAHESRVALRVNETERACGLLLKVIMPDQQKIRVVSATCGHS